MLKIWIHNIEALKAENDILKVRLDALENQEPESEDMQVQPQSSDEAIPIENETESSTNSDSSDESTSVDSVTFYYCRCQTKPRMTSCFKVFMCSYLVWRIFSEIKFPPRMIFRRSPLRNFLG